LLGREVLPLNSFDAGDGQGQSRFQSATKKHEKPVDSPICHGYIAAYDIAQMAELVDALVSGTSAARRGGSSPLLGTNTLKAVQLNAARPLCFSPYRDRLRTTAFGPQTVAYRNVSFGPNRVWQAAKAALRRIVAAKG
jgi:hypothetical protein